MAKISATHLVISCIDHRCTNDVARAVGRLISKQDPDEKHPEERYDLIALPGASLGPTQTKYPAWGEAFWQQVEAALALHHDIRHVLVFDHLQCGAYRLLYAHGSGGADYGSDAQSQLRAHERVLGEFAAEVKRRFPQLEVGCWVLRPTRPGHDHDWTAHPIGGGSSVPCS